MYYLLTFENTHDAITAKQILKNGIKFRTVPILREISTSCGISIRVELSEYDKLITKLEEIKSYSLYSVDELSGKLIINKIIT